MKKRDFLKGAIGLAGSAVLAPIIPALGGTITLTPGTWTPSVGMPAEYFHPTEAGARLYMAQWKAAVEHCYAEYKKRAGWRMSVSETFPSDRTSGEDMADINQINAIVREFGGDPERILAAL